MMKYYSSRHVCRWPILITADYDDIQYMACKIIEEYRKWGLEMNLGKTACMCIGGIKQDRMLNNGQISSIKHYRRWKCRWSIPRAGIQGRKAIWMLNSVLWDQNISTINKHKFYNSIVKSIKTYSNEVWPLKENNPEDT